MSNPIHGRRRIRGVAVKLLIVSALLALLGAVGAARADNPMLIGDVGLDDSYTISLKDASGTPVTHLPAGTYTLVIHDHSSIHNFDLNGPGVSVATGIDTIGDKTATVTFTDGTYFYDCDDHPTQMKGSFTVGSVTTPPPAPTPTPAPVTKLGASIAAGGKATLKPSGGLSAGKFKLTVSDRTAADGFRLSGPGVSKATGVKFKGTVTWTGAFQDGKYSFGSVRKPKLRRSLTVSG
jgi:hypothetical protein